MNLKNFILFLWRPRPPTLLPDEKQKEIRKNLKKYYAQFESKDRVRMTRASKELLEKRAKLREQFVEYRTKRVSDWEEQKYRRIQLRNSKFIRGIMVSSSNAYITFFFSTDTDTDTLDADPDNVEEEIVEILVREDTTLLE